MKQKKIKKWYGTWPINCQLCGVSLENADKFYDCVIHQGRWALICPTCFIAFGTGLGTGVGQVYDSSTLEKIGG